jgi:hypothetical protein
VNPLAVWLSAANPMVPLSATAVMLTVQDASANGLGQEDDVSAVSPTPSAWAVTAMRADLTPPLWSTLRLQSSSLLTAPVAVLSGHPDGIGGHQRDFVTGDMPVCPIRSLMGA